MSELAKFLQRAEALQRALTRGSCSGRVAWQFVRDVSGRLRAADSMRAKRG